MGKDIDKILNSKSRNVQEQNVAKIHEIKSNALWFRENENKYPQVLIDYISSKVGDIHQCLVNCFIDLDGVNGFSGLVVTAEEKLYDFDLVLDDEKKIVEFESWEDVTASYEICERKRGIGKTQGFLFLEALSEINSMEG